MNYSSERAEWLVYNFAVLSICAGFAFVHFPALADADDFEISTEAIENEEKRFLDFYHSSKPTPQERLEMELSELELDLPEVIRVPSLDDYRGRTEPLDGRELVELLSLVGFDGYAVKSAWAIVMNESTGNPMAHNTDTSTGDNSYGIFQINMLGRMGEQRREAYDLDSNAELFDPVRNAEIAYEISNGGTDFGDWRVGPNAYRGDGSPAGYTRWLAEYPGGM